MGKPFKLDGGDGGSDDIGIVRGAQGRFERKPAAPPADVLETAKSEGRGILEAVRTEHVADHPTPKGNPQAGEEIEPLPNGPMNDANKKPFRVG